MLHLLLGIAGSGKTGRLLAEMKNRAKQGQYSVFLVPDQFSSSSEAMVLARLGDAASAFVEVVSFRTLAERIFKSAGGPVKAPLTDAGRVVLVRRALDAISAEMKAFARHRQSAAFCNSCAQLINEFKTAGATPRQVREIARAAKQPRIEELALVFEAYESALSGVALDPQDRLVLAAGRAGNGYFTGKACFVDNFDGFTSPEYALLEAMLRHSESVTVALCCEGLVERDGGLGLFSPVRRAASRLIRTAEHAGVSTKAPETLPPPEGFGPTGALNRLLAFGEEPDAEDVGTSALTLSNPVDEWAEVRAVAAEIHRLAAEGIPYSRMAVICRDMSAYEAAVRREFGLFGIPWFSDASASLEYTAPVAFIRAALAILRQGFSSQPLLALLKSGLCGYSAESIAALENYVFTWNPRAADWRTPFEKNPGGLLALQDAASMEELKLAEALRRSYIPKIERFIEKCRGVGAEALAKQLYLLLAAFDAPAAVEKAAESLAERGEAALAEDTRRAWDLAMDLLDEMAALLGSERVPPLGWDELFVLLVRATDFGQLPQTLECVTFTAADRMRLDGPEVCFVLGLCEGEFPMQIGYSGLLTHADRDLLVAGGIEMPGGFEHRTLLEEMVFYRALTAAKGTLHLSWPMRRAGGVRAVTSSLGPVQDQLQPGPMKEAAERLAATPAAAFDLLGGIYRDNTPEAAALYTALNERAEGERWLSVLDAVDNGGLFSVQDEDALRRAIGSSLALSATRAERYYQCRFSYFLERVLHVKPRRKAELTPVESGTLVHHLLEQVLAEAGAQFATKTDGELAAMARRHANAFIEEHLSSPDNRSTYLLEQIKASTTKLLFYLRDAAAQSGFTIDALELEIGDGENAVPPLEVTTLAGDTVRVTGKIDRVDVMHRDGKDYLCIIDYKTGTKKFSLDDVYCGLNMQMLIYLHTLLQNGGERYQNALPAGVLYLTGDPAPPSGSRTDKPARVYELDGLLLDDAEVLRGLDKAGEGLFLPFSHREGKPLRAGKKLADLEKLGRIATHTEELLRGMAEGVFTGDFAARPLVKSNWRPCTFCGYRAACRHEDGRYEQDVTAPAGAFDPPQEGGEL